MDGMGNTNISFCKEKLWGDIFGMRVAPPRSPSWHPTREDFYTTSICCEQKYLQILVAFYLWHIPIYNLASYPKIGGGKRWFFLFNWITFKNQVLQSQVTLFGPFESRPFHGWKRDVHFWGKKSRSRMEEAGNRSSRIFFSEMYSPEI